MKDIAGRSPLLIEAGLRRYIRQASSVLRIHTRALRMHSPSCSYQEAKGAAGGTSLVHKKSVMMLHNAISAVGYSRTRAR